MVTNEEETEIFPDPDEGVNSSNRLCMSLV